MTAVVDAPRPPAAAPAPIDLAGRPDPFALIATSDAGRTLCDRIAEHAPAIIERAAPGDAEGELCEDTYRELAASGVLAAGVPIALGGLGVTSVADHVAAMTRLGRADGSVGLAVNMHLSTVLVAARSWRHRPRPELAALLGGVGAGLVFCCNAGTEPGTALGYPLCEVTEEDGALRLRGRKTFATGAKVATHHLVFTRDRRVPGVDAAAYVVVDAATPGVRIEATWDGLGMRASGSDDLVLDCEVPREAVLDGGPWGVMTPELALGNAIGPLGNVAVYVGIAEAARALGYREAQRRRKAPSQRPQASRPAIQAVAAQLEVDLTAARGTLAHAARAIDAYLASHDPDTEDPVAVTELLAGVQATKLFAEDAARRVVDAALALSGGSGYRRSAPLARLWRDVRAGPFMQAFAAPDGREFVGAAALGMPPTWAG